MSQLLELAVVSSSTQLTEITGRLIQSPLKSEILQGTLANLIYDGQCANCAGAVPPRQNSWHWSLWKSEKLDSASSYSVTDCIDGVYFVDFRRPLIRHTFVPLSVAHHIITGQKVAVKILNKGKIKHQEMAEKVRREINILKMCTHPHIIRL